MRAGALDRRILIESKAVTRDTSGQELETWSTFADIAAGKRDTKSDERFASAQREDRVQTTFRIRYRGDITPAMRLIYKGDAYDILGTQEVGRLGGEDLFAVRQIAAI